jgi:hypothetical protein
MFSVKPVTVKVLDQDITVKALSVTRMLEYRKRYNAIADDDIASILTLMQELIVEVVLHPVITVKELDEMGQKNLKTLFDAVAIACGLSAEKNG